ncbi:hypothetical protein C1645_832248 [Glomus cerebriforme]|uniref:Uncharacterized protein n=1 Tax=Glomus cerebriforme TaxID=658196 RepID=A0A397SDV9_9GLOM|nr:hypothetical protein C1645_832248 [Glomus cerebriforme]
MKDNPKSSHPQVLVPAHGDNNSCNLQSQSKSTFSFLINQQSTSEMQKEVEIYKELANIQDKYILKLVCYEYYGGDLTHYEEDFFITSTELVTFSEQVVKESISACSFKNIEIECQKIPYNQKVEQDLRQELSSTKVGNSKINKIQDIINNFSKKATNTDNVDYKDSVPNWNEHVTSKTNKTEIQVNFSGTLDYYSNLYREFSSENFDYYGITDETSFPLCKLNHGNKESIKDRYKPGSYFIKCE